MHTHDNGISRSLRLTAVAVGLLALAGAPTATAVAADATSTTPTAAVTGGGGLRDIADEVGAATTTGVAPVTTQPTTTQPTTTQPTTAPPTSTRPAATRPTTTRPTGTVPATTTEQSAPAPLASTTQAAQPSGSAAAATLDTGLARTALAATARSGLSVSAGLPAGTVVPGATSANGSLPTVTVTDNGSGSNRMWTATVSCTDFVGPSWTIPRSAVTYRATAVAGKLVGGELTNNGAQTLDAPKAAVARAGLDWPLEVITWTPVLSIDYPNGAAVGSYTGTVTISVA